jgi:hypothetical protein
VDAAGFILPVAKLNFETERQAKGRGSARSKSAARTISG